MTATDVTTTEVCICHCSDVMSCTNQICCVFQEVNTETPEEGATAIEVGECY